MYIYSVLFSFLEAALKRRPRATEAEIKLLMCRHSLNAPDITWWWSAMVEKTINWETHL